MNDPNFEPKEGQTKEQSAWALCNWLDQQGKLKAFEREIAPEKAVELSGAGPFKVVLPISAARRVLVDKSGEEREGLWLRVEASGPERDADGERMSLAALEKMVEYVERGWNGDRVPFLDGHYRDLMAAVLGEIHNPNLNENNHFGFDVLVNENNQFAVNLFNDILSGRKKHGASIAGIVHDVEYEILEDGKGVGRVFNDVEIIEVSRTSWPSWRPAFITLLARSAGKNESIEPALKRKQEIIDFQEAKDMPDMIVRTDDGGEEVWTDDNEKQELMVKITSPHGWDKKFGVSNAPWSSVKDRSKPCQFAIIKKKEDGEFSRSKSGYPHHMPGCNTINRGGTIAAGARLIQALKSAVPELETPPLGTLGIAAEEMDAYEEKAARFSREELVYAARHILKHYRRDLEMEPPENLVSIAKAVDPDDDEAVAGIVKELVKYITNIEKQEDNMPENVLDLELPDDTDNPDAPDDAVVEPVEQAVEETVTEPGVEPETEAEPVSEEETEAAPAAEVAVEPEPIIKETDDTLASKVDARLLSKKFGALVISMHEMVFDAVRGNDLEKAHRIIDEFAEMAKENATGLVASKEPLTEWSVAEAFAEKVELEKGQLSKSRVARMDEVIETVTTELVALRELMKNADVLDDTVVERAVELAAQAVAEVKSAERTELEERMAEVETKNAAQLEQVARALVAQKPEPAEPKTSEGPQADAEIEPKTAMRIFENSLAKGLQNKR